MATSTHSDQTAQELLEDIEESRTEQHRLGDDLELLRAERAASSQQQQDQDHQSRSMAKTRSRATQDDAFNTPAPATTFVPAGIATEPPNKVLRLVLGLRNWPRAVRYFFYMTPIALVLLIPVLLGRFLPAENQTTGIGGDGGVSLLWFGIWLEILWLSLWAARMIMTIIPPVMAFFGKIGGASTSRKWKALGRNLEMPFAWFFWMLAVLISFKPILNSHRVPTTDPDATGPLPWIDTVFKVIIALFVLAVLHLVQKILIQWIASSFHKRQYATRIQANKDSIAYLVHLYEYSKQQLFREDSIYDADEPGSGAKTPMAAVQKTVRQVGVRVGDMAQRIRGDFTGQDFRSSTHPRKVVSELLRSSTSAQVLARRLFRTFVQPDSEVLVPSDLNPAFPTTEDADQAFSIFDRDLNGDVSCEELEAMCDEVHREKKAISASLKDLDDVVNRLDAVFLVIVVIISIIVLLTIISTSAATALGSLGTVVLGLSWLLQATAQEFLQSIIFVFVKHPFDIGDRVTVYGNTGDTGSGDDYYVTAISLLYTEFKKMQGQIVQAPNSILNTLFILNHRRSHGLADVNTLRMKFGTPQALIEELVHRMTLFVHEHKRDYGSNILTEMTSFEDSYATSINFIFFHKSSYQNETQRLLRHNRFACKLQEEMVAVGIEQPRRIFQISGRDFPVYNANIEPPAYEQTAPALKPASSPESRPFSPPTAGSIKSTGMVNQRRRAGTNISMRPTEPFDFQNVFESRKAASDNPAMSRLRSARHQFGDRTRPSQESSAQGQAQGIPLRKMRTATDMV